MLHTKKLTESKFQKGTKSVMFSASQFSQKMLLFQSDIKTHKTCHICGLG